MFSDISKKLRNIDKDDLLEYLGVETKRTTMDWLVPTVVTFGVGMLVGAGIGLMLAPKSGADLREDLRQRLTGGPDQLANQFPATAGTTAQKQF